MKPIERETLNNGVTLELYYDADCECPMERDDDGVFFAYDADNAGFPHDKNSRSANNEAQEMLEHPENYPHWHIFPVRYRNHGPQCIVDICEGYRDGVFVCAVKEWAKREDAHKYADAALKEYTEWANGGCYGYRLLDRTGKELDACWGLIGYDYALEEARGTASSIDLDKLDREEFYRAIGV